MVAGLVLAGERLLDAVLGRVLGGQVFDVVYFPAARFRGEDVVERFDKGFLVDDAGIVGVLWFLA